MQVVQPSRRICKECDNTPVVWRVMAAMYRRSTDHAKLIRETEHDSEWRNKDSASVAYASALRCKDQGGRASASMAGRSVCRESRGSDMLRHGKRKILPHRMRRDTMRMVSAEL
jgi:hypothetical protein